MNIEELKAAAEVLAAISGIRYRGGEVRGKKRKSLWIAIDMPRSADAQMVFAKTVLAVNALPKLLAVVEALAEALLWIADTARRAHEQEGNGRAVNWRAELLGVESVADAALSSEARAADEGKEKPK